MATNAYTKINGMWRSSTPYIKVSGTWKKPDAIYQKTAGNWKLVWGTASPSYTQVGFCPYKDSPSSTGNLYGVLREGDTSCEKIYGANWSGVTNALGELIFEDYELYQPDEFNFFYRPAVGETCSVTFRYPPTSGQSGKKVYIICGNGASTVQYEIVNANEINAGSCNLYFNGSTFTITA